MQVGRVPTGPFRWDLVSPDQLGGLLDGVAEPDLWFLPDLVECAGRVLARSANGDLYFVGRSPDSIFDLLSGALSATTWRDRCYRLPLSLWTDPDALTPAEVTQFRTNMSQLGIDPYRLARGRRPVTFVDLVYGGRTYENLFLMLRRWIAEDNPAAWPVVRTKLRFIGILDYVRSGRLPDPLTKDAAIDLVRTLMATGGGDERTVAWWLEGLARRTGCLHISDMIYWPAGRSWTAEEIIDHAWSRRPIAL